MLVRVDGPMVALWLWAAAALLPRELSRGADTLSWRRLLFGAGLLLAAVLVKPTALLCGAPLVVGWFLVARRSALRLSVATAVPGPAILLVLQWLTAGGFVWVTGLWRVHPTAPGLAAGILAHFLSLTWPVLLTVAIAGLLASTAKGRPLREASLLLGVGGLAVVPLLGKSGASWNYLIPFYASLVVIAGR